MFKINSMKSNMICQTQTGYENAQHVRFYMTELITN